METPDTNATAGQGGSGSYQDALSGSTPTPAQPTISNAVNAAQSAAAQPTTAAPAPAPAQPQPPATPHRHGLAAVLAAVGDALGGGSTMKRVNPQTGVIEEVPRSTGSKVGTAITTLIRGAAAGAAQHGPGSVGMSAVAGADAQNPFQQQQQNDLLKQSQNVRETNAATMQQKLDQASLSMSNQQMVRLGLDIKSLGLKLSDEQAQLVNSLQLVRSVPGAMDIGHFSSNQELNDYLSKISPAQSKQHASDFVNNVIRAIPTADGGFEAWQVPKGWQDRPIGPGQKLMLATTVMGNDGKPKAAWRMIDAPEDMTMGQFLQWQGSTLDSSLSNDVNQAKLAQQQAATQHEKAATAHEQAETSLTNLNIQDKQQWLNLSKEGDVFGDPIGDVGSRTEYNKRVDSFAKDYGKDLNQLDQASSQLNGIIKNAQTTGKLPGAASVVGLFDAIGISSAPLKGRGFRINNEIVGEHAGARNVLQSAAVKLQKVSPNGTGQVVTLQQLQDYAEILNQARHDAYLGAADASRQQGIGVRVVPQGHNTPADAQTVKLFLDMAGGNPQKATKALQASGWQVNP